MNSLLLRGHSAGDADILPIVGTHLAYSAGVDAPTTAAETAALLSRFKTRNCSNTLGATGD